MKGYINITMNGNSVGLKFAYPAIRMFAEALEKKPDLFLMDVESEGVKKAQFTIEGLAKFIQCGYVNNCLIKEVEPGLTYQDFFNYAEESQEDEKRLEEIGKVFECWGETTYAKKLAEPDEEKKTLTGTT
jgi:hypothetical protein